MGSILRSYTSYTLKWFVLLLIGLGCVGNPRLYAQPDIPEGEAVPNRLIVQFKASTSPQAQGAFTDDLRGRGFGVRRNIAGLNAIVLELPDNANINALIRNPLVASAEPDYYIMAQSDITVPTSDPYYVEQWGLEAIGAPNAWQSLVDAPIVNVAVIDSGICADHVDLTGRVLTGYDFIEDDTDPQDEIGHGCGVTGIIAANIDNGVGIAGAAPNVHVMPLRVLDTSGQGTYSALADAMVYAVDNGARVINLSLGGAYPSSILASAVDYAAANDVIVIAAAGNTGDETLLYPAAYDSVIAVGALNPDLQISNLSSRSTQIDIWLPGEDIITIAGQDEYVLRSGTSTATAFAAAMVLSDAYTRPVIDAPIEPEVIAGVCDLTALAAAETQFNAITDRLARGEIDLSREAYREVAEVYFTLAAACNPDETVTIDDGKLLPPGIEAQFELLGTKWGGGSPIAGNPPGITGGTVTYSYMPSGIPVAGESIYSTPLTLALTSLPTYDACFFTEIENALAAWEVISDITFVEVTDNGVDFNGAGAAGHIRIGAHAIDGAFGQLAHAYQPPYFGTENQYTATGDLHFDTAENWSCDDVGFDIGVVAMHEIGHVLGLDHEFDVKALMNGVYDGTVTGLLGDDIDGAVAIYGAATNPAPPPPNNAVETATVIGDLPYFEQYNTYSATSAASDPTPSCGTNVGASVWYEYTPTVDQGLMVSAADSSYSVVASIWVDNGGTLVELDCDENLVTPTATYVAEVESPVIAGTTYYIMIGGSNGDTGDMDLKAFAFVPNDFVQSATIISSLPFSDALNTFGAISNVGDPVPSCAFVSKTVWYQYTPTTPGMLTVDSIGSDYNTVISVWTGDISGYPTLNLTEVGCDDDIDAMTVQSEVSALLIAGETYHIMVGGEFGAWGELVFNAMFDDYDVDLNNDGIISPTDAIYVVNRVGTGDLTADIDGDADVDSDDVDIVLGAMGALP